MAPVSALEGWAKTDPETKKAEEKKMQNDWNAWMGKNRSAVKTTEGLGKNKSITSAGIADAKNGMMLYSIVEAESHEAAAELFKDHPHLGIPNASIEIMEASPLAG